MAYLEELLPEFRKGAKITRKYWGEDCFFYYKAGIIYDKDNKIMPKLDFPSIVSDDWELYQEPINWDYIIKNRCLCKFWNKKGCEVLGFLKQIRFHEDNDFYTYISSPGAIYTKCCPVRRDEVTFYENVEDD